MHRVDRHDFTNIVNRDEPVVQVATGFGFTEGPIWHPGGRHLTFSDMPGNHMRRLHSDGSVETFRKPSNMANGNAYEADGSILTCEHATSRVVRIRPDGQIETLASHYEGRELNSPNDIVLRRDGSIYFTDPTYGRMEHFGLPREPDMEIRGVYRLNADGALTRVADDFNQPNGLCFSLDEARLFVNDTEEGHIRVFNVESDGSLSESSVWAVPEGEGPGRPDGMKLDSAANLYCTGPDGIHVYNMSGECLGAIAIPEYTANFNWGDDDRKGLYVTASTSVYRVGTKIAGPATALDTPPR